MATGDDEDTRAHARRERFTAAMDRSAQMSEALGRRAMAPAVGDACRTPSGDCDGTCDAEGDTDAEWDGTKHGTAHVESGRSHGSVPVPDAERSAYYAFKGGLPIIAAHDLAAALGCPGEADPAVLLRKARHLADEGERLRAQAFNGAAIERGLALERDHARSAASRHHSRAQWAEACCNAAMRDGLLACRELRYACEAASARALELEALATGIATECVVSRDLPPAVILEHARELFHQRDEARSDAALAWGDVATLTTERDAAQAEVATLRALVGSIRATHATLREVAGHEAELLALQRDAAVARVAELEVLRDLYQHDAGEACAEAIALKRELRETTHERDEACAQRGAAFVLVRDLEAAAHASAVRLHAAERERDEARALVTELEGSLLASPVGL